MSFHTTEEVQRGFFRANSASRDATYPARRREQKRLKRRRCEQISRDGNAQGPSLLAVAGRNFYWSALHVLLSAVQSSMALLVCSHAAARRSLVFGHGLETPLASRPKPGLSRWPGFFLVRLLLVKDRHGKWFDSRRILHGGLFCGLGLARRIISAAQPIANSSQKQTRLASTSA